MKIKFLSTSRNVPEEVKQEDLQRRFYRGFSKAMLEEIEIRRKLLEPKVFRKKKK
jgi:hypothetical protein